MNQVQVQVQENFERPSLRGDFLRDVIWNTLYKAGSCFYSVYLRSHEKRHLAKCSMKDTVKCFFKRGKCRTECHGFEEPSGLCSKLNAKCCM
ncbi:uncharacterized protein LOC109448871 [Rhinolophus sinicus]|uniref:uncharacterized protein LOC109448871 n=1 Tax=Rhinolophus sinicus TaxID=89399 RepID=UPI003D78DE81